MDFEFEKTLAMLSGQSAQDFDALQISEDDKTIINNAIEVLFTGICLQQWLTGVQLGQAWNKSFDILRDTIFAIPVENLMTKYVRWATFEHIRKTKIKMTSVAHTNEYIKCPDEKRNAWNEDAETKIQNGMEIIRRKIMEFAPGSARYTETPSLTPQFREIFNSRELQHEREREREREK